MNLNPNIFSFNSYFFSLIIIFLTGSSAVSAQCFDRVNAGETCSKATYICGQSFNGLTGTLPSINSVPQDWRGLCNFAGSADNILWYSFRPCSNTVTLEITVTNCYIEDENTGANLGTHPRVGVQAGLFGDCNVNSFLDCSANPTCGTCPGMTGTFTVTSDKFIPGELGYFYIDGLNIQFGWLTICDFQIKVLEGIDTTALPLPDISTLKEGRVYGTNSVSCSDMGNPIPFYMEEPDNVVVINKACQPEILNNTMAKDTFCYFWNILPNDGASFLNNASSGTSVDIVFTKPGRYIISAETEFNPYLLGEGCSNTLAGNIRSWEVIVNEPDTLIYPIEYICAGTTTNFCGQTISSNQIIICVDDPCQVIQKEFVFDAGLLNDMGRISVCESDLFEFQGVYYGVGSYSVLDTNNCNLRHSFQVEEIVISTEITSTISTLTCDYPQINLQGIVNSSTSENIVFYWEDAEGKVVNINQSSLIVTEPGVYKFFCEYSKNGNSCAFQSNIEINQDIEKPSVEVNNPIFTCLNTNNNHRLELIVSSNDVFRTSQWIAPNGNSFAGLNIVLDSTNVVTNRPYRFIGIGLNGCTTDTLIQVQSNFTRAKINMTGDDLSCYNPTSLIEVNTDISIDSIRWFRINPGAFFGSHLSKFTHLVDTPGVYYVEVKASQSKCWSQESLTIVEDKVYPEIDNTEDIFWNCNTETISLQPLIKTDGNLAFSWGTNDGQIVTATNQKNIIISDKGTYQFNVLNTDNGCESRTRIEIIDNPDVPSELETQVSDVTCHNYNDGELRIINTKGGEPPYSYKLNGNATSLTNISDMSPGDYDVTVIDQNGCEYTTTLTIQNPPIVEIYMSDDIDLYFEEEFTLTFSSNYSWDDILDIQWYNKRGELLGNDIDLIYSGYDDDIVELVITTVSHCESRAKIKISVDNDLEMYFPNIFSPNGDGINDNFVLYKNRIPAEINSVAIYDRFGNLVFQAKGAQFGEDFLGWDGTFNGQYVQSGVYIVMIDVTNFQGKREIISKDLTVIR